MKKLFCLLITLAACTPYTEWTTPADLKPIGPDGWADEVWLAADDWNVALEARGCGQIFSLGETFPVTLTPVEEWPFGDDYIGMTYQGGFDPRDYSFKDSQIFVRDGGDWNHKALLHELGHALTKSGAHTPTGVMAARASATELTEIDIDYAISMLDCR